MSLKNRRPGVLTLVLVLASLAPPRAGWADVKLYLEDGTFQLVKSYEVHGDRVRYYSVERSQWEEVPVSIVDFGATERAQKEEKSRQQQDQKEAQEIDKQRFERPADAGFEVAPGIRLPKDEGVFAFDGTRLIRLVQSSAEIVTDKKRAALNMVLPPVLKNRSLAVLPGPKAAVRIFVAQPTFYVQFAEGVGAKVELISVKQTKEARVLEKFERSSLGIGKPSELRASVPLERTEVTPGLFRLRPTQPLARGEYALAELIQQKLNLEVWDFGIGGALAEAKKTQERSSPMSERPPTTQPEN